MRYIFSRECAVTCVVAGECNLGLEFINTIVIEYSIDRLACIFKNFKNLFKRESYNVFKRLPNLYYKLKLNEGVTVVGSARF